MQTSRRNTGITPGAWLSLRALLVGGAPGDTPLEEVARAAVLGEVEGLALQADPRLAPWLEAPCARRAEEAVVLFFAEARVTEALEAAGIDRWVALKGTASARLLYDDPALRPRRDVDILIDGRDMTAFEAAAEAAGWADVTHATHFARAGDGPYEREYLLDIGETRVGCDVHRRLLRWREFQVNVSALLSRARVLDSGWRVCAPEDLLLHTAMHAANMAFDVPLRAWVDVQRLVDTVDLDWDVVVARATSWRARRCVFTALHVAATWLEASVPPDVFDALVPRAAVSSRLARTLAGQSRLPMTTPANGALARATTRILVRDSARDALRYIWQTVTREVVIYVTSRRSPSAGPSPGQAP